MRRIVSGCGVQNDSCPPATESEPFPAQDGGQARNNGEVNLSQRLANFPSRIRRSPRFLTRFAIDNRPGQLEKGEVCKFFAFSLQVRVKLPSKIEENS
jgi:hypothetical protein